MYFDLCQRAEIVLVGLNMHFMTTSGMHRRPFEGRHLVGKLLQVLLACQEVAGSELLYH